MIHKFARAVQALRLDIAGRRTRMAFQLTPGRSRRSLSRGALMRAARTVATMAMVAMVLVPWPAPAAAADQDALGRAKALYTSAAYDEALALLSQLDQPSPADAVEANQYRAFCLLALGRSDDARRVIQDLVEANPAYQPPDAQMSPRLQAAFRGVRRGVLPSIVRRSYAEA